jgi:hypothetical protein
MATIEITSEAFTQGVRIPDEYTCKGAKRIQKGVARKPVLIDGSRHGTNSYGRMEYSGPCAPPGKPHHYHFDIYALDTILALRAPVTRKEIGNAMEGHILGKGSLMGLFSR